VATWVPDACTLPTAEQPLRVAEFDELFAAATRPARRPAPDTLEIFLAGGPDVAASARDLITQETACCSFFTFSLRESTDGSVLEVRVPASQVAVLDGLQRRVDVGVTDRALRA
jgi:hypothetical protein